MPHVNHCSYNNFGTIGISKYWGFKEFHNILPGIYINRAWRHHLSPNFQSNIIA